ncbi:L-ascorbate oxidase-like protein [Senna tora]|uniref:L-ascorbate oxidase-like protein n=1 Tax=Senna tora TaxID=362788 RepID=A0A834TQF0_9FABA|nr:L-ascorbate oxidase-like protein [Senna tora]
MVWFWGHGFGGGMKVGVTVWLRSEGEWFGMCGYGGIKSIKYNQEKLKSMKFWLNVATFMGDVVMFRAIILLNNNLNMNIVTFIRDDATFINFHQGSEIYWIGDVLSNFTFESYNRQSNSIWKQGYLIGMGNILLDWQGEFVLADNRLNGVLINGKTAKGDGKDENSINVRFQNHPMRLVEIEGFHTVQNNYDSLDIHIGQCFTVLVTTNKEPKDYYLVASTHFSKSTVTGKFDIRYKNGKGPASPELLEAPVGWACSLSHFHTFRWNLTASAARPNP